jgi:hypothetical protein
MYRELADRWSCSVEAVRRRALRGRWQKQLGNDGKARVLVPDGVEIEPRTVRVADAQGDGRPGEKGADPAHFPAAATIAALEGHVATLKAELDRRDAEIDALKVQLAGAEARASEDDAALREHNATLKADVERLEAQLAAAEARTEKQAAEVGVDLAAERARADKAIEAFAALADRLDALAQMRARPWWKRLTG